MELHRCKPVFAVVLLGLLGASSLDTAMTSEGDSAGPVHGESPGGRRVPRPHHVVLVLLENKRASQVIGNRSAPYLTRLAKGGADFTQSYALTHPSQPNYLALFSGSAQGVIDDSCGHSFGTNNQAHQLRSAGFSFKSYSEGLPTAGSKACTSGGYARKHAPWTNFTNVPASAQRRYRAFPHDYTKLPDVSWVIPNLCHDMHSCPVATGDSWLKRNFSTYAHWARAHHSLLIVTFDEDDFSGDNHIATVFYGGHVRPGHYREHITHYDLLATIEVMYGLPRLAGARLASPITNVWK